MTWTKENGERLRSARKEAGRSRADLAKAVGVTRQAIGYWERGAFGPGPERRDAVELLIASGMSDVLPANQAGAVRGAFTDRELATVLAALRYWQRSRDIADIYVAKIAARGGVYQALDAGEIDALCERLDGGSDDQA